jgi:hypothetical protein
LSLDNITADTRVNMSHSTLPSSGTPLPNAAQLTHNLAIIYRAIETLQDRFARIHLLLGDIHDPATFTERFPQVIVALATLQTSVQDLSRAYINHANTVLAPGRGGALDTNLTNILSESGLLASAAGAARPAEAVEEGGKKKRKRIPHDPNAPKRALTPYFLYMQSARGQIAKELGEQAKPKEVADEGTRRWTQMPQVDKTIWDNQYQKNLAAYRVKMAAYKAGQPVPSDEEAARLVEAGQAPPADANIDAAAETEDESPEPVKAPTPPAKSSKRRKTTDTPAKAEAATPKSPEKEKKGKKAKAAAAAAPEPEKPAPASAAKPEKKKKTKKA